MLVLKLNSDKSLTLTKNTNIYKLENNADKIWCLFTPVVNNINLSDCTISLQIFNQDNIESNIILNLDTELFKGYLQCYVPITKDWTYKAGNITLRLNIVRSTNEVVLKTNEVYLSVNESREANGTMPEQPLSLIDQLIIDIGKKPNIDDNIVSTDSTYSSSKIEAILAEVMNPFTATITVNPSIAELGGSVASCTIEWAYNKNITSQTLDGINLDTSLRSYIYSTELTSQKTFSLYATTVAGTSINKTATVNFYNGIYYGKSSSMTYDFNLINSLNKVISDNKARTITVTANTNEYIYYCLPSRLGSPLFAIGGFSGGFSLVSTINFTNSNNYTEYYNIYRSDNANLGITNIVIS